MAVSIMGSHRLRLIGVRMLWIALALVVFLYLIAGLPHLPTYYGSPCDADSSLRCTAIEIGLQSLSLDWAFYTWYRVIGVALVCILVFVLCSLLAWRKRDELKTLLFSIALLVAFVMNADYDLQSFIAGSCPAARVVVFILAYLGQIGSMVCYVFPDGRFVPRWTRWAAIVFAMLNLAAEFLYWWSPPSMDWPSVPIYFVLWIIFPLTLAYALLYRYRKTANLDQRQQIKWIVWVAALAGVLFTADAMINLTGNWVDWDTSIPTWYAIYQTLVSSAIFYVVTLLGCLSFYVAILRYRLWDIDFFINRSLVYGGLTILLGLVMVGVYSATQALLGIMVTNMQAGAAGIVSLIVAIALFVPVRDRLQRLVDSRVYGVDPNHERAVQVAIAQERDRLSQELHDSVAQSLYGLTIMAESGRRLIRDGEAKNPEEPLIEMGDVARQALREMRLLIHELRPPVLEEEGLLSALHQRLAAVEKRSGIEANLSIDKVVDLPIVMEEALYHIAIEALNNAIKHAAATSVSLSLRTNGKWVELEVADNGEGFDPGSVDRKAGMGLAGMHKRAEELGGTLAIHSAPGQGTKVTARVAYHTDARRHGTKRMP